MFDPRISRLGSSRGRDDGTPRPRPAYCTDIKMQGHDTARALHLPSSWDGAILSPDLHHPEAALSVIPKFGWVSERVVPIFRAACPATGFSFVGFSNRPFPFGVSQRVENSVCGIAIGDAASPVAIHRCPANLSVVSSQDLSRVSSQDLSRIHFSLWSSRDRNLIDRALNSMNSVTDPELGKEK
jgi:hypothetical protein